MSRVIGEQKQFIKKKIEELKIRESDYSPDDSVTHRYGFLTFTEDEESDEPPRLSQFIRLALKTDPEVIVKFMKEGWKLPTPHLIISITGGAKYSELSARVRKAFQLGVVSAAATTHAWIITAGTNAGVVKEVGEALNKYRYKNRTDGVEIPCIGIGSWGYTSGRDQLDRSLSTTSDGGLIAGIGAIQMRGEAVYGVQTYVVKKKEDKKCDLEPNHTHFLLFDDGTESADSVLALRADIEMSLRRANLGQTATESIPTLIPIIMILVEGGPSSIETIYEALDANTPVVVVKESGRAADLVSDLYQCFSKDIIDGKNDDCGCKSIRGRRPSFSKATSRVREINAIFAKARKQCAWADDVREKLCQKIRERRQLITIFNFDSPEHHGKLEEAILEALFKAATFVNDCDAKYESAAELRLALAWRNLHYANAAIFTDQIILKWKEEDLREGLVDALRLGYTDFIQLFIEYGITLNKITLKDLDELYATTSTDKILPFKENTNPHPTRREFYEDYLKHFVDSYDRKDGELGNYAIPDLIFYALFFDRFDLVLYLCSKTWNQSVALIFGARIYRKAAEISLDSETKQQYENNADKLDRYAASVIDQCFENDRDFAIHLLRREAVAFYKVDSLSLALKANCRAFLASKSVQKHLDNEWFGNINYKRPKINIRIFICSLFFPLIPIFFWTLPYLKRHQPYNPNATNESKNPNASANINTGSNVPWTKKICYFYRAPIVRFYYNLIFFFVFLALFSYVLLLEYYPLNTSHGTRSGIKNLPLPISEICLHTCIWGIIIEEVRQFYIMHSFVDYLAEVSNLYDLAAIVLYLISFVTRFIVIEEFFMVSKIFLGLDLILWYIRILHLFAAYERLGPKLIMIFNTMKDLLFFVYFILIFLFGFSITSWSLISTPDQVKWNYDQYGDLINVTIVDNETSIHWKLLRDITNYGVWKVFAQVDIIDNNTSYSAVAFILAILFVAISNVLLLNVLVALFNVTIENVQDQSHDLWRYQRFLLVNEFRKKSLLPPPFNTLDCIFAMIKRARKHPPHHQSNFASVVSTDNPTNGELKITDEIQRECAIAEDFWQDLFKKLDDKTKKPDEKTKKKTKNQDEKTTK